jgi:DNA-binding IclR family transcriptional regulator
MAPRPSPQTTRVVDLVEMLAGDPGRSLSLAEISRRLDVHKASCHSMLTVLAGSGWLVRDPTNKAYQLGPAMLRLGSAASTRFPALDLARPVMASVASQTGGHCIAFLVGDDHVTVAHQVRNLRVASTPMAIGTELPTRPPYGASLAAWVGDDDRERWLARVPADARDRYRRALLATRRRGYSVGLHVLPDVRLQELASLIRATETRSGRLGDLAEALTQELLHREEWFPSTVSQRRTYEVSHIDAPVIDAAGDVGLILSLVPVPSAIRGSEVMAQGELLSRSAAKITAALGGSVLNP